VSEGGEPDRDRKFIRRVLIVLALAAAVYLLWQLRIVVVMLFGAVVVASVFRALADLIKKWVRLPDGAAVALSIVLILGSLAGLVYVFGGQIADQVAALTAALPEAWASLRERIAHMGFGDPLGAVADAAKPSGRESAVGIGRVVLSVGWLAPS